MASLMAQPQLQSATLTRKSTNSGKLASSMMMGVARPVLPVQKQQPQQRQRSSQAVLCQAAPQPLESGPSQAAPQGAPPSLINMSRRTLVQGGLATVGLATCPCCPGVAKADEWDYEMSGANMWQGVCASGQRQSPVNLPVAASTGQSTPSRYTCKFGDIEFKYGAQERVVVLNTGHGTMQVNFKPGNIATIGGVDLELLQFHFHTPSEHALDGRRSPMEVHLVHKVVSTGGLAVIGIMLEGGAAIPNPAVQTAYLFAPAGAREQMAATRPLDPLTLLPPDNGKGHRPYVHYAGSLTTPPCSEGVDWFVMTQPIRVTDKQVLDFMKFVGGGVTYAQNSRPVQPVGARQFKYEL